jgi:hypothetical protein
MEAYELGIIVLFLGVLGWAIWSRNGPHHDLMSPLRWTCKSLRQLASEMKRLGHKISHTVVGELLKQQKFGLQGNRKTREGEQHPDRNAQFAFINTAVKAALAEDQPVISVDTKRKSVLQRHGKGLNMS